MRIFNFNFGICNTIKNSVVQIVRRKFNITDEWFNSIYQKHYTSEFGAKYHPDLYIEQGVAKNLISKIHLKNIIEDLHKEMQLLEVWIDAFRKDYIELKRLFDKEDIKVNITSKQHEQLELLYSQIDYLKTKNNENRKCLTVGVNSISSLSNIDNTNLKDPHYYDSSKNEVGIKYKYIDRFPRDKVIVPLVFKRLATIIDKIKSINYLMEQLQDRILVVHGNAGMGKSNLSAHISQNLQKNKIPFILLKAKSFSGESTEFETLFMNELEIPNNYHISEILGKLNNFGISQNTRVPIIIDGLNETSNANSGFSDIWRNKLDSFISQVLLNSNLILITTLRTSYLKRIWGNEIPYSTMELTGFSNLNLEEAIHKYFMHYKISDKELHPLDCEYFRTPLMLDLYCQMLNPLKEVLVPALLGINGFKSVFENYIERLANEITINLKLISSNLVYDGLSNCSDCYLSNTKAHIDIVKYYQSIDRNHIQDYSQTIGFKILEGYLIFLQDSLKNRDVIFHTQQEVGGYLLAKRLLEKHDTIKDVVDSEFFQKQLLGRNGSLHQLKDDILKFLIVESEERNDIITQYAIDDSIKEHLWLKLRREPATQNNIIFRDSLVVEKCSIEELNTIMSYSRGNLTNLNSNLNFPFIKELISDLKAFDFDLTWTKFTYEQYDTFIAFIDDFRVDTLTSEEELIIDDNSSLKLELAIWLLETTIQNIRDKATQVLLEYGTIYPEYIFEKLFEFSITKRLYIYERLASIAYGICLRKQNDDKFINGIFKDVVPKIYNLQFSPNPTYPTYHYIVIDSLKHIIDLAIHKGVFNLEKEDIKRLNNYQFNHSLEWDEVSKEDQEKVGPIASDWHSDTPDPLGKDFVTYTIPRLLVMDYEAGDEYGTTKLEATAQIYRRILNSGYLQEENFQYENELEKEFYYGVNSRYIEGKIDRLGKKYSWNALFEYAGFLLNQKKLDVWYEGESNVLPQYKRLSDVEFEVTYPTPDIIRECLFKDSLLAHKCNDPSWTKKELYDLTKKIWNYHFFEYDFTLLKGSLIQKQDDSYDVESYLLIESFLLNKADIVGKEESLINKNHDWVNEFSVGQDSLFNVYHGELYWADSIPTPTTSQEVITADEIVDDDTELGFLDRLNLRYCRNDISGDRDIQVGKLSRSALPTVIEYVWETDSNIYPSLRDHIPSPNIGRFLGLKSDPQRLTILDKDGVTACKTIKYSKDNEIDQNLNYLRSDLLHKYLEENNLVLVYQIKQHTYDRIAGDGNGDFRGMQFFFPHLSNK